MRSHLLQLHHYTASTGQRTNRLSDWRYRQRHRARLQSLPLPARASRTAMSVFFLMMAWSITVRPHCACGKATRRRQGAAPMRMDRGFLSTREGGGIRLSPDREVGNLNFPPVHSVVVHARPDGGVCGNTHSVPCLAVSARREKRLHALMVPIPSRQAERRVAELRSGERPTGNSMTAQQRRGRRRKDGLGIGDARR